jgi:cysteine desulfurase
MGRPIYMDHHATTPVDARVVEAMLPYFTEHYGNAASRAHAFGHEAAEAVEEARRQVASLVGAPARTIVFTSGATESDNLALKGVMHAAEAGAHLIVPETEHKAVLDSATRLEGEGFRVTRVPVGETGVVDPATIEAAIEERTVLVSVMLCNNEVGAVSDIGAIGAITRERGVLLHCDASQGLGYLDFDVDAMKVDLASFNAHKLYGPKGVGALFVRRHGPRVRLVAEADGGGQEHGLRAGTPNVPGIVGFGAAAAIQEAEGEGEAERLRRLRDALAERLLSLEATELNGPPLDGPRHPANLNVSFAGVDGEGLLLALAEAVAVSSGAACTSASTEPSYVLRAMGLDRDRAATSIRFGLGRPNDAAAVDAVAAHVEATVARLRAQSPLWRQRGQAIDW